MIFASLLHSVPSIVLAQLAASPTDIPQLDTFLSNIQTLFKALGTTVFVVCVIIAGIMRMISGGNERRVALSNMAFTAAVIGLAIVLLAAFFGQYMTAAIPTK
jgi:type IV secretory pathway VirB2 component (pilin)